MTNASTTSVVIGVVVEKIMSCCFFHYIYYTIAVTDRRSISSISSTRSNVDMQPLEPYIAPQMKVTITHDVIYLNNTICKMMNGLKSHVTPLPPKIAKLGHVSIVST